MSTQTSEAEVAGTATTAPRAMGMDNTSASDPHRAVVVPLFIDGDVVEVKVPRPQNRGTVTVKVAGGRL